MAIFDWEELSVPCTVGPVSLKSDGGFTAGGIPFGPSVKLRGVRAGDAVLHKEPAGELVVETSTAKHRLQYCPPGRWLQFIGVETPKPAEGGLKFIRTPPPIIDQPISAVAPPQRQNVPNQATRLGRFLPVPFEVPGAGPAVRLFVWLRSRPRTAGGVAAALVLLVILALYLYPEKPPTRTKPAETAAPVGRPSGVRREEPAQRRPLFPHLPRDD